MEKEKTYLDGFNAGHKLRQYNPELFEKVKGSLSNEVDFEKGVLEGALEFEKNTEQARDAELEGIRKKRGADKDQER